MVYSRPAHGEGCGGRKPWAFKTDDIAERSSVAQTRASGPTWLVPIRECLRQDIMFEDRSVQCSRPGDEERCDGRKPWAFKTDDIAEHSSAAQTRRLGLHDPVSLHEHCFVRDFGN